MNIISRIGVVVKDTFGKRNSINGRRLGWIPDHQDYRDLVMNSHGQVAPMFTMPRNLIEKSSVADDANSIILPENYPNKHELVNPDSPEIAPRNQLKIGSCASFTGAQDHSVVVWLKYGEKVQMSTRYLYLVTRRLAGLSGDSGSAMRDVIRAMKISGAPPESLFPYDNVNKNPLSDDYYDKKPSWFVSQSSKANRINGRYIRLDTPVARKDGARELIVKMCRVLANGDGTPIMGGFYLSDAGNDYGVFTPPKSYKDVIGGHAMLITGYDTSTRRFTVMNSWGTRWGQNGFGKIPFEFILNGFASDFWIVTDYEYVDSQAFKMLMNASNSWR